jgi:hypothetical protein
MMVRNTRVLVMYYFGFVAVPGSGPKDLFVERVIM